MLKNYLTCKSSEEDDIVCKLLSLMTGNKYLCTTIRGCCQGNWQDIYYPSDKYSDNDIEYFETEYFNTGTEWIIHDEENEPKTVDDISGYSMYCYTYDIGTEIAEQTGCNIDDLILYEIESYSIVKHPIYKKVVA